MALAHCVSAKTVAAYNRSDLFERRSRLMSAWTTSPRPSRRRKGCADVRGGLRVVVGCSRLCGFGSDSGGTGQHIRPGRIAHRTNLPFPTPENGGALTAVADRLVYFACSRVSTKPTSKPPQRGWLPTWLLA